MCSRTSRLRTLRLRRTLALRLLACCPVRWHKRLKRPASVCSSPRVTFPRAGPRASVEEAERRFWFWFWVLLRTPPPHSLTQLQQRNQYLSLDAAQLPVEPALRGSQFMEAGDEAHHVLVRQRRTALAASKHAAHVAQLQDRKWMRTS